MRPRTLWIIVGLVAVGVVGFILFRPDTLFVDDSVDESLEDAFGPVADTTPTTVPEVDSEQVDGATPSTSPTPEPAPPVELLSGAFYGIDHTASGTATVYEADGVRVLRFEENTDIQNGPDLYVWLVPSADYEGGTPDDVVDLGRLKGNVGGQNYELGADFEPGEWTVLIWCKRFAVPFAAAPLA